MKREETLVITCKQKIGQGLTLPYFESKSQLSKRKMLSDFSSKHRVGKALYDKIAYGAKIILCNSNVASGDKFAALALQRY